jgi:hypothetical protein
MSEQDWSTYDAFLKEADRDNRIGDQDFIVTAIEAGVWPSGDKFTRVRGQLLTAGGAKADFNLNPLPSAEDMAQAGTWETAKKRGVAQGINFLKSLDKFYSRSADTLQPGDELRVKCVKNKEGFIRIVSLLDPRLAKVEAKVTAAKSEVPF